MQQYFELSNALIKSGGVIWDDHNGGSEGKLFGLAALFTGKEVIPVGLHKADYFSLNRVYLKDGKVHLSDESVAGTLFPVNFDGDVWDCINDYNEKQAGNKFSCGTLENPMGLEPIPVTVITMTIDDFCAKMGLPAPVHPVPDLVIEYPTPEMKARAEELRAGMNLGNSALVIPVAGGFKGGTDGGQNHQFEGGRVKSLNVDFHPTDGIGDFPDKPNS
jgi:hypothetical protein